MSLATVGRTITVDGGASADADGTVVEYLWEFGDGSTATGSRVSHTYTTAGTYLTTLAIRDDQGGEAFTSADHIVDIPQYKFEGFLAPVDAAPVVNAMKAGHAVPMKFRLGGNFGLGIVSAGSPTSVRVDCTTGANVDEVETLLLLPGPAACHTIKLRTPTAMCGKRRPIGREPAEHST
ncbi:PKD domain-containing protein [Cryobacterium ruanii]|uniref:PKD domain-containing protein n=1 Tax=Cryobacterium ruanii TaxID=1259197 RepID=A0A4R9ALW7_9MICO|nr:PKD domain-containing protein [Cryobacterium ruanii]